MTLHVGTYGVTVIEVAGGGTSLVELGSADHVGDLLASAFDRDVVLVLRIVQVLEILVPLGVAGVALGSVGVVDVLGSKDAGPYPEFLEFVAAHHVVVERHVGEGGDTVLGTDGDGGLLVVASRLRGDEHDTVRSTGSVDRGCGRILQDGDGLDVVRVHSHDGTAGGRDTVDDEQRCRACTQGTDSVECHGHVVVTGDTTGCQDRETGDLSLQLVESRG